MKRIFERNFPTLSEAEQSQLSKKHALIIGAGGLGGFLMEFLARAGVGEITVYDGDVFEESNRNRQILSLTDTLGVSKVKAAKERAEKINPDIVVHAVDELFTEENASEAIKGKDIVLDALDNVPSRLILSKHCDMQKKILVHGAICGWIAQVCVIEPGSGIMQLLYGTEEAKSSKTSISVTPPFCAALQSAEAIKLLCGRRSELSGKLLMFNLQDMKMDVLPLV